MRTLSPEKGYLVAGAEDDGQESLETRRGEMRVEESKGGDVQGCTSLEDDKAAEGRSKESPGASFEGSSHLSSPGFSGQALPQMQKKVALNLKRILGQCFTYNRLGLPLQLGFLPQ